MISDGSFSPPTSQPPLGTSAQATPVVSSLLGGTGTGSGAEPRFLPNFPPLGPPRCLGAVSRTNTAVTTALGRQPLVSAAAGAAAGGNATRPPVSVAVSSAASAPSALGRTYAEVGGPSRTGANGFRRVAPHIAAQPGMPVPTHQGRKWTVLADIKPVRPNHTRDERAQFVLRDLGAPPTSLLQAYVLHVDQLLLISFRDEAAYEAALDRLQRGVPWGAAGGRKVYGHSTLDLCLNVRVDNVPIEVPDHVVTEVLEEYGRVLTPKRGTLPGTVDVYDGILHCRMRLHPGVVLPDFIALEIQGQVLDEVCRIMTDVHVRRCFKCGQTNHVGQACRFAAKTIKQQGAVWTRAWYAEEDVEVPAPRTRPAAGPPPVHRPPLSGGPRPSAGTQGSQGLVVALPGGISVSRVLEVTMDREVAEVERDQGKKQESEPFFSLSGQLGASMPLVAPFIASSPPTAPPMASGQPAGPPVATGPLTGPPKERRTNKGGKKRPSSSKSRSRSPRSKDDPDYMPSSQSRSVSRTSTLSGVGSSLNLLFSASAALSGKPAMSGALASSEKPASTSKQPAKQLRTKLGKRADLLTPDSEKIEDSSESESILQPTQPSPARKARDRRRTADRAARAEKRQQQKASSVPASPEAGTEEQTPMESEQLSRE